MDEVLTIPEINLELKIVEHQYVKLVVMMETWGGDAREPRFARILIPETDDLPDGYTDAAKDYLENVRGFSATLTMQLMNEAHQHRNRVMAAKRKKPDTLQGEHINADGEFQSDKYPWCRPGFVPLKLSDPMAWPVLWDYAKSREAVDAEFSADLRTCLRAKGYTPLEKL